MGIDLRKISRKASSGINNFLSSVRGKNKKNQPKKVPPLAGSWESVQAMPQAEKDRIRIAKKKKLKSKMYPPPKRKPSLASKTKPKRKPMTKEQTNKVLKKMGLRPLRKNKGKNG